MDVIDSIKKWIIRLLIILSCIEMVFFPSVENMYGCLCFIYAWLLVGKFVFLRKNIRSVFLLPTICIIGYIFGYFFLALPVTLLEGKPLTFNFEVPYLTWSNQILHITTIVLAFLLCTKIYKPNNGVHNLWEKMGYFKVPTKRQIWLFGFLGVAALLLRLSFQGYKSAEETDSFVYQLLNFITLYSVFPVCLFFPKLYGSRSTKSEFISLSVYILFLLLIAIGTTKRTLMFSAIVTIGFAYIVNVLISNKQMFKKKYVLIVVFGIYLITGPVAELAMAMILNRQIAGESSTSATFEKVMSLYNNKEMLNRMYNASKFLNNDGGKNEYGWSEYYVNNIFFDRFCNVRVIDASLFNAQRAGIGKSKVMKEYRDDYFIRMVPSFILDTQGIKKKTLPSTGDVLAHASLNVNAVGSRVVGDTGAGLSIWGYLYYPICLITLTVLFLLFSTMVKIVGPNILLPVPILCNLLRYFVYFGNDYGIFKTFGLLLRDSYTAIILYCLVFFFIRKIIK